MKRKFFIAGGAGGVMISDDAIVRRSSSDFAALCERDLDIIRHDLVALLQETADVRATMLRISSGKPAISKSFFVLSGLFCLIIIAALVIFQPQLRVWLQAV